jgi:predicted AAA+ superfamily ATPase
MLSSDLATYIAGRYIEFKMYTLAFREFLLFRGNPPAEKWDTEFQLYMRYGGFPGIHHFDFDDEVISQYLSSIYNTIVLKDVVKRNNIRDISLLERVARFTAANCGNITSPKKISDFLKSQNLKSSTDTVMSYLNMLSAAFIFHKTARFDIKGKRFLEIHEKYYPGDIGLKHSLIGFRFNDIAGHLENIVYLELLSRGFEVSIGKLNGQEIDFVAKKGDEQLYIQVAYLLTDISTVEREFSALEKINDNHPKMVLSLDKFPKGNRNGIIWQNLIDFLTLEN